MSGPEPDPRRGDRHRVKARSFRPDDEALWDDFRRKVRDEGKTISSVLSTLIRRYLNE